MADARLEQAAPCDRHNAATTMLELSLQVIIVLLLIAFNGLLAMSELAVVSSRAIRLQQRAESGDEGAITALALAREIGRASCRERVCLLV